MKKNNAWNIRRFVDESFVPSTQRASVLYWRLTDFWPITDQSNNCVRIAYFATIAWNLIVINFYLDQTISTKYPMDYIEFINAGLLGIWVH